MNWLTDLLRSLQLAVEATALVRGGNIEAAKQLMLKDDGHL